MAPSIYRQIEEIDSVPAVTLADTLASTLETLRGAHMRLDELEGSATKEIGSPAGVPRYGALTLSHEVNGTAAVLADRIRKLADQLGAL